MTTGSTRTDASPLWAITCHFNPVGFQSRLANYHTFRAHLEVPLLTVEWSVDGRFRLSEKDADILIRIASPDLMWQKERLLDIGLRALPGDVEQVAWLDCDVVFQRPDWPVAARRALESSVLVQLFSRCVYRGPEGNDDDGVAASLVHLSRQIPSDTASFERLWGRPKARTPQRDRLAGHAWAGRRDLLERHGFYDACILGAGDRAFACAAFGEHRRARQAWLRTAHQKRHYFAWADAFAADVDGRIGLVDGDLIHLWHGTLESRQHRVRHLVADRWELDPEKDIEIDPKTGCWRWASPKHELHEAVARFFAERREDQSPEPAARDRARDAGRLRADGPTTGE